MANLIRSQKLRVVGAALVLVVLAAACDAQVADFTGDGKADQVYWSSQTNSFYTAGSTTPMFTGQDTDTPVPGDYNGDGKWEPAVLRGTTWISAAMANPIDFDPAGMPAGPPTAVLYDSGSSFTAPTLIPVPGDYDGSSRMVPAYFDEVDDSWWIMGHSGSVQLGTPPTATGGLGFSVPAPADYDGDGKTDIAVFDPPTDTFRYLSSKTGQVVSIALTPAAGDDPTIPVPGDYDKVGHAQAAATDESGIEWVVAGHTDGFPTFAFPSNNDLYLPAPGDYGGNGQTTPAQMDQNTGTWRFLGQGTGANTTPASSFLWPAELPASVLVNFARLAFYGNCLERGSTSGGCQGVLGA